MYALLLAAIVATRSGESILLEAGPGHYKEVVVVVDGDPAATTRELPCNQWEVATKGNSGTFSGLLCGQDSCTIVEERFTVANDSSLASAALFAVGAGFLLNFMPCVLPVLGLKLLCFAKGKGRREYMAGVMVSFMALATLAIAIGAGLSHMSLPSYRMVLAVVCFLMGTKLLGWWELPTTGVVGEIAGKAGPFGSGVLTVALGSSCSVPFLAPVLVYLATCGIAETYLLFGLMGVGFLAPFMLPIAPLMRKFGPYVRKFEVACAVAMFAVFSWIMSTLNVDYFSSALLLSSIGTFFLVTFHRGWTYTSAVFGAAFVTLFVLRIFSGNLFTVDDQIHTRITEDRNEVIVVTADWCVNCKFVTPIWSDPEVQRVLDDLGYNVLTLHWNDRDPDITNFLSSHSHVAIPFALVTGPDGGQQELTGIYTKSQAIDALRSMKNR